MSGWNAGFLGASARVPSDASNKCRSLVARFSGITRDVAREGTLRQPRFQGAAQDDRSFHGVHFG